MTLMTPIISIIVPVFNLEDYVVKALDSILAQENYSDFEVLVIDDHSTDNTFATITEYAKKDARIKILTNQRKKGVAGARNTGFDHAQGKWIAFLDGDDTWESDNLASLTAALDQYPEAAIIIADRYEVINQGEKELLSESDPIWHKYFNDANKSGQLLRLDNPARIFFEEGVLMRTGTCLIKNDLIKQVGVCDEELKAAVDMSWFFKLATHVNYMIYVPKAVMTYMHRAGSLTRTIPFGFYGVIAYKKMLGLDEFKPYKKLIKKQVALWAFDKAYFYRKNNDKINAIGSAFEAVLFDFNKTDYWKNLLATLLLR
ncbi:MAG: glycosyltransferase family A protein [Methylovulum sp.]|nr:glycosyltransferase family A protein [Methylovulum sp.]